MHSNQAWLLVYWACRFFCGTALKEPQIVLDFPYLFYPQGQEKDRLITVLQFKDLLNALRHFACTSHTSSCWSHEVHSWCVIRAVSEAEFPTGFEYLWTPGSWVLRGKLRLDLLFFSLRNYLLQTSLYLSVKCFSCDKGTISLNSFARKVLVHATPPP